MRDSVPKKYDRLHNDLEDLLDLYLGYANLATSFNESYDSFTDKLKYYDQNMASKMDRIMTYFK